MFENIYAGKKVFLTGHTGFKGSWLCRWLLKLGADVYGYSLEAPSTPANFDVLGLKDKIVHFHGDVRNREKLADAVREVKPDIVFHLAAQALVRESYRDPASTFETNAMGTMNVLESIRQCPDIKAAVFITSDKCYRNVEWTWGYRENDVLGGEDPYSSSKGCAELIIYSYINSFFSDGPNIASTRAGNVIGGGDWAADRIVPDAVRAWSAGDALVIRSPKATRPWQHVLEPLSGYLWLGCRLFKEDRPTVGQAFNFGPDAKVNQSVEELLEAMAATWPSANWNVDGEGMGSKKESTLLKLSCDKALNLLGWRAVLSFEETTAMTADWYRTYYEHGADAMDEFTVRQIDQYASKARAEDMIWAK